MGRRSAQLALSEVEQAYLQDFIRTGTRSARALTRARSLLMSAIPQPMAVIAATLAVCPATVQNVRPRYRWGGLDAALQDKPRSGQPRRVPPREEASITTIACSTPPEGHARWTIRLLTDRLVERYGGDLSTESVRQVLKTVSCNPGHGASGASARSMASISPSEKPCWTCTPNPVPRMRCAAASMNAPVRCWMT
jgi:putative transposase